MTVTLPQGMFRHPKTGMLWVRKDVPKPLRLVIGKTSLKVTLKTKDPTQARALFHAVMQGFEHQLAAARLELDENRSGRFSPRLFTLDLPADVAQQFAWAEAQKPENRMQVIAEQMDRRLQEVGLAKPQPAPVTMDELLQRWRTERKPAIGSYNEYARAMKQFVKLNGDLPISEYTVDHARSWKDHVLTMRSAKGETKAHATYVKIFGTVRTLFNYADRNDLLATDPFAKITLETPILVTAIFPTVRESSHGSRFGVQTIMASIAFMFPQQHCADCFFLPI